MQLQLWMHNHLQKLLKLKTIHLKKIITIISSFLVTNINT